VGHPGHHNGATPGSSIRSADRNTERIALPAQGGHHASPVGKRAVLVALELAL
jgi:hypothetical protein